MNESNTSNNLATEFEIIEPSGNKRQTVFRMDEPKNIQKSLEIDDEEFSLRKTSTFKNMEWNNNPEEGKKNDEMK